MRVRYPRGWPPGWGKHPAFATFLSVLWGAAAVAAMFTENLGYVRELQPPSAAPST